MEEPITGEINSEITGLNKGEKGAKKKKLIIGLSISAIFIIVLVIILILVFSNSRDSKNDSENDIPNTPIIGEINLVYDIQTITENTILFGNKFTKNSDFDIYIDRNIIKYSKEYKFNSTGTHEINIKLYNDLNMDYMFNNISELISVEMKSEDNCNIISMISTFENTENLNDFSIIGFNGEKIKSMEKLFYKSS